MNTKETGDKDADEAKSVKTRKKLKAKKTKTNVEGDNVVKDSQENVDKVVKRSSKSSKKKPVVEEEEVK